MTFKPPTQLQGITDLTVLAKIKPGLIDDIFPTCSHLERLRQVLGLLDAGRRVSREADPIGSPFVDPVGRLRGIHFFRFAILPDGQQLFLNVTFDGGWEPYLRLVWKPLGTMLDLIFCHCEHYPLAAVSPFEDYIRWVREHEVPSQFFYADSPGTSGDRTYLGLVEAQQRAAGARAGADLRAAQLALDAERPVPASSDAVAAALRTLKALHGLAPYFGPVDPANQSTAGWTLLRFAQEFLPDLRRWIADGLFDPGQPHGELRPTFEAERRWLMLPRWRRPEPQGGTGLPAATTVQAGILQPLALPDGRHGRGALVLLRVRNAGEARKWLAQAAPGPAPEPAPGSASGPAAESASAPAPASGSTSAPAPTPGSASAPAPAPGSASTPATAPGPASASAPTPGSASAPAPAPGSASAPGAGTASAAAAGPAAPAPGAPPIADAGVVDLRDDAVVCTVALTYPGLQTLDVPDDQLAQLPSEFIQGMEARAGILGDVRGNHPQQWHRPRDAATGVPIDPSLVHLVVQLRTAEAAGESAHAREVLLPRLRQWIGANLPTAAFEELAVEPMWSRPRVGSEVAARNHFGYVDGVSQPTLAPSAGRRYWDDVVKPGEVLLGRVNDRGDGRLADASARWLDDGSFLVVRKIRLYVDRFDGIVERAAAALLAGGLVPRLDEARELVRARLMGRGSDGRSLVSQRGPDDNDFDFRNDGDGAQCPFASHARRTNPRAPLAGIPPPRIVRRGASYGPPLGRDELDRGTLFMAYNASIAEQFEVLQRWVAGGNSSGVSSSQPDPFLGVPRIGEPHVFRFTYRDQVVRVDLGDQPLCRLEWGLYAFVPSITWLSKLDAPAASAARTSPGTLARTATTPPAPAAAPGVVPINDYHEVLAVLSDDGSHYSASGYGTRMAETIGPSPFGWNDAGADTGHADPYVEAVKRAIEGAVADEDAYRTAYVFTQEALRHQLDMSRALRLSAASVDMVKLGTALVAHLCEVWFGVIYETDVCERGALQEAASPVRCPGHFLSVARYVFSAAPNDVVRAWAPKHGAALKLQIRRWVAAGGRPSPAPVLEAVLTALDDHGVVGPDQRAGIVGNIILGLPATTLGSWVRLLTALTADRSLWRLQHDLAAAPSDRVDHARAVEKLRPALIAALVANPVADGIWRTATQATKVNGGTSVNANDRVSLNLGAALRSGAVTPEAAEDLLFGGARAAGAEPRSPHACPGRGLAINALLGALAAWLQAGEWAVTPSPTTLALKAAR